MTSRILVAGAGAVGSLFGAFLRRAGHEVALLGRGWHLDAVRTDGLHVDGLWGAHAATGFETATGPEELDGGFDALLVAVKAYDTAAMVAQVAHLLRPDGIAISLQNGLGNVEALAAHFGGERSFGASVLIGARLDAPGHVTVTVQAAPVVLGPLTPGPAAMRQARAWAARITAAGISAVPTSQVRAALWSKVLYNAALNPLGALLDVHYGALGEDPDLRSIMDGVIAEAFAVAVRQGIALPWRDADDYRAQFYGQLLPDTSAHRSSMLQDLERGRRTEIDAINGAICRAGAALSIPTPLNALLTRLVRMKSSNPSEGGTQPSLHPC